MYIKHSIFLIFITILGIKSVYGRLLSIESGSDDIGISDLESIVSNLNFTDNSSEYEVTYLEQSSKVGGAIRYILGSRVPGDRLAATGGQNQSWPQRRNVAVTLSYPTTGIGLQVTYVEVLVNQDTNLGQAYVIRGGIFQRFISLVVEAYNVTWMNYTVQIYGK